MKKMVLLVLIAVISCLYACSNIDGLRDLTANGGGTQIIVPQQIQMKMEMEMELELLV